MQIEEQQHKISKYICYVHINFTLTLNAAAYGTDRSGGGLTVGAALRKLFLCIVWWMLLCI